MEGLSFECTDHDIGFSYLHKKITRSKDKSDPTHAHKDLLEIFLLLNGNVDYVVEGKQFHVNPYDMVLVSNYELHRSISNDDSEFECVVLSINLDFFVKNNCTDFTDMIFNRSPGTNNVIPAATVIESGIYDIYLRVEKYAGERPVCMSVVKSVIIELIYNIDKHMVKSQSGNCNQKNVKQIVKYIDDNITQDLSLNVIANHFFMRKQYLCKLFKKNTGFTVNKYISYKRIVLVREFYSGGMSISEACIKAGFNDYSNFYRAFTKMMHEPPKKSLENIRFRFENSMMQNSSEF